MPRSFISVVVLFCLFFAMAEGRNPYVDDGVWEAVQPYLIPGDHKVKAKLDHIFHASRVTASRDSVRRAGFIFTEKQGAHGVTAFHPELPGYVVKIMTDDNPIEDEWISFLQRINGAQVIQNAINEYGYKKYFKVPKKWIYPLPAEPRPFEGSYPRNFVLIVEDMKILPWLENRQAWKANKDKKILEALYRVLKKCGLTDSLRPHNVPFSRDGRIAFVDTAHYNQWPVNYHQLLEYMSSSLWPFWKELTGIKKAKTYKIGDIKNDKKTTKSTC